MGNDGSGELALDLLRPWRLRRGAAVVQVAARQQRLIAALAVRGPSLRHYLIGLLWPEFPESNALESLRVTVHMASRQAGGLIVNDGELLSLNELVDVDLHRARAQTRALHDGGVERDTVSWLTELRDAELLPGWYEDWVLSEQGRLRQDRFRAFTAFARRSLERGQSELAESAALAAVDLEPLDETAVRFLVSAQLHQGNSAAAIRSYDRYRTQLEQDLQLQPSEHLRSLIQGSGTTAKAS